MTIHLNGIIAEVSTQFYEDKRLEMVDNSVMINCCWQPENHLYQAEKQSQFFSTNIFQEY